MSPSFPPEPDFQSLHQKGWANLWWFFWLTIGIILPCLGIPLLQAQTENWWLTGAFTAIAYIFVFGWFNHLGWKERTALALVDQGLDGRVWANSRNQQIKLGFSKIGEYFGFELLSRPIGQDTPYFEGHEVIIRSQRETIAVANVIRVHDDAYWRISKSDQIELNEANLSLSQLFEQHEVRARLATAQAATSDFICIGLATQFVEAASASLAKSLSLSRARSLGVAILSHANLNSRRSHFHAVGLGQCREAVDDPESTNARNQRAAVILAIIRRQDIPQELDLERITEALVQNYKTQKVDLSNYEFSNDIANQIQNSEIDFAGYSENPSKYNRL